MAFAVVRNDILKIGADAVICSTGQSYKPTMGDAVKVYKEAGPELSGTLNGVEGLKPGEVAVTEGFALDSKIIIHTLAPMKNTPVSDEVLAKCYTSCLEAAQNEDCKSVAFSLLSTGNASFPLDEDLKIAFNCIRDYLAENDMLVYLAISDESAFKIDDCLYEDVRAYVDENYIDILKPLENTPGAIKKRMEEIARIQAADEAAKPKERTNEYFSEMLCRLIEEKGLGEENIYKYAGLTRTFFDSVKKRKIYMPSNYTVLAFAIALHLNVEETGELLEKAGYALSGTRMSDVIIKYFLEHGRYDIFEVNAALFRFEQKLIGCK